MQEIRQVKRQCMRLSRHLLRAEAAGHAVAGTKQAAPHVTSILRIEQDGTEAYEKSKTF